MNTLTHNRKRKWFIMVSMVVVLAAIFSLAGTGFAQTDSTGSVTVTGGALSMGTPADPAFTGVALDGTDKTTTATSTIDVKDLTGTGAGWNLQVTSTTFTSTVDGHTLANTATTITGVLDVCDATCTAPTNSIGYAVNVPADTVAPVAVKFFNAALDTGMGDFTITPTFQMAIPADTFAGTYESTITVSLVSAP
jgi:hypothetical protein